MPSALRRARPSETAGRLIHVGRELVGALAGEPLGQRRTRAVEQLHRAGQRVIQAQRIGLVRRADLPSGLRTTVTRPSSLVHPRWALTRTSWPSVCRRIVFPGQVRHEGARGADALQQEPGVGGNRARRDGEHLHPIPEAAGRGPTRQQQHGEEHESVQSAPSLRRAASRGQSTSNLHHRRKLGTPGG